VEVCCWPALQNILPKKIGLVFGQTISVPTVCAHHDRGSIALVHWPPYLGPYQTALSTQRVATHAHLTSSDPRARAHIFGALHLQGLLQSLTLVVIVLCLGATAAGKTEVQQRAAHAAETSPRRPDADTTESMAGLRGTHLQLSSSFPKPVCSYIRIYPKNLQTP
jgi:hypothetical protein